MEDALNAVLKVFGGFILLNGVKVTALKERIFNTNESTCKC